MHEVLRGFGVTPPITTDGHRAYLQAVLSAFGIDVAAQLIKIYGPTVDAAGPKRKYGPGECYGISKHRMLGQPIKGLVSTSNVEKHNQTMRQHMKRFARLTNGFSKKVENLRAAVGLHFAHYNFVRQHKTLRVTPAMAADVSDRMWTLDELVEQTSKWGDLF
jgi:hypothetical protein